MPKYLIENVIVHIRHSHPDCPDFAIQYFAAAVAAKDWKGTTLGQAVGITMQTFLRHEMTDYDTLLLHGMDRRDARRHVQPRIQAMLNTWQQKQLPEKRIETISEKVMDEGKSDGSE